MCHSSPILGTQVALKHFMNLPKRRKKIQKKKFTSYLDLTAEAIVTITLRKRIPTSPTEIGKSPPNTI